MFKLVSSYKDVEGYHLLQGVRNKKSQYLTHKVNVLSGTFIYIYNKLCFLCVLLFTI